MRPGVMLLGEYFRPLGVAQAEALGSWARRPRQTWGSRLRTRAFAVQEGGALISRLQMPSSQDANHAQVQRIIASTAFRSSDIHRKLLTYLAERSLAGLAQHLKEYTVGLEVFGKPASYDPRQESAVRMHVGRLRQKLVEYYRIEGAEDPILVDLPKGGFSLTFSARPPAPASATTIKASSRRWPEASRREVGLVVALVATLVCAGYLGIRLARSDRTAAAASDGWTPQLHTLWTPILSSDRPLLVTFATASSSATTETASAAFLLGQFLGRRKHQVFPINGDALSLEDITMGDVIFIGPANGRQELQAIPHATRAAFVLTSDGVKNLNPSPGEVAFLADDWSRPAQGSFDTGESYALISCLPGLHGAGVFYYFEGNQVASVVGAVQAMTEPDLAAQLVARLTRSDGAIPRSFQVVLRVKAMDDTPVSISYVAHRELPVLTRQLITDAVPTSHTGQ